MINSSRSVRVFAVAAPVMLALVGAPAQSQDVDLSVKLEVGTEHTYVSRTVTYSKQAAAKIPGGAVDQTIERQTRLRLKVVETNFRSSTVEVTYERIWIKLDDPFPGLQLEFDSDQPVEKDDDNDLAGVTRPLVGLTFTLIVGSTGIIEDARFPQGSRPEGNMGGVVLPLVDLENLREELGPIFTLGAGRETRSQGDRWTTTSTMPADLGIDVMQRTVWTVSKADSAEAVEIELSGELSLKMRPGVQLARAEVKKSTLSGSAIWNARAGRLESFEQRASISMVAEPVPGMVFRLESKTEQHLERVN